MPLDPDQINRLAKLSGLYFSPQEKLSLVHDLDTILSLIDRIQSIPDDNTKPLSNPFDEIQILRSDSVTEHVDRDTLQSQTQFTKDGFYLVPRVVD